MIDRSQPVEGSRHQEIVFCVWFGMIYGYKSCKGFSPLASLTSTFYPRKIIFSIRNKRIIVFIWLNVFIAVDTGIERRPKDTFWEKTWAECLCNITETNRWHVSFVVSMEINKYKTCSLLLKCNFPKYFLNYSMQFFISKLRIVLQ